MNELKIVNELLDMFELKKFEKTVCNHCNHESEHKEWYCFKLDVITAKSNKYNKLSNMMNELDLGDNYAYDWTIGALEVIKEHLDNDETLEDMELYEDIDGIVDVYTSDLTDWLGSNDKNIYYLEEAVRESDNNDNGLAVLQMAQYDAISNVFDGVIRIVQELSK